MIIQATSKGRCKKCSMFIEPGDWVMISTTGEITLCMFDSQPIREYVREKEKNSPEVAKQLREAAELEGDMKGIMRS